MTAMSPVKGTLRAGVWEAVLNGPAKPEVEMLHDNRVLAGLAVTEMPGKAGGWALRFPVPAELLSEGVQTFVLRNKGTGEAVAQFAIIAGVPIEEDIRAEMDLLRAELDMLKRAFRRHCLETAG
jgi:hypothetical protein